MPKRCVENRHGWRLANLTLPGEPLCRKCVHCGLIEFLKAGHWTVLTRNNLPEVRGVESNVVEGYTTRVLASGEKLERETA